MCGINFYLGIYQQYLHTLLVSQLMTKRIYDALLIIIAGALVFAYSQKPEYNWDMISYMGVALNYSEPDMQKVHDEVYATLEHETPANIYSGLTADIEERRVCLENTDVYTAQLSYFKVKPLYTGLVFLLHKAGIPLVEATLIPSFIAAFFLLIILYYWLTLYINRPWALLLTMLLGMYAPFREITELSSPDALSNLFLMLSLYMVARNIRNFWLPLTLALAIICRVDNFIFAAVITYFTYLKGKRNVLLSIGAIGILAAAGVIIIPMLTGNSIDWFRKFAYTASVGDYVQHWRDVFFLYRHSVYDIALTFVTLLLFAKTKGTTKTLINVIAISVCVHMLLFPSLQERFLVTYEFGIVAVFVSYMVNMLSDARRTKASFQLQ